MEPTISLSFDKTDPPAVAGETYTLSYKYTSPLDGLTVTQIWDNGDTTPTSTRVSKDGNNNVSVTITFNHDDFLPTVLTKSVSFFIGDDTRYIHPLDSRNSAFIWCDYWVLYEIQNAHKAGIDWKQPNVAGLKYMLDIRTIVKMLTDYEHVEIMESRNGHVLHKKDFVDCKFY